VQTDLIVMGARHPGVFRRLFARSVTRTVTRLAHCPVLLVQEPARYELIRG
jgi:nucleotide-binding universal stress UspA family protein